MKYIKVFMYNEYSVFEVIEEYKDTIKCKLRVCENGYIIVSKKDIIKQTNTIEELCDEFVIICSNHNEVYSTKFETLENIKFWYSEKAIVYGAIWTDKGLIYVAKMNEKGELVLI